MTKCLSLVYIAYTPLLAVSVMLFLVEGVIELIL